jgi:TetR/AcrR family transcriptional regulator, transcriptional repressor for nem operon
MQEAAELRSVRGRAESILQEEVDRAVSSGVWYIPTGMYVMANTQDQHGSRQALLDTALRVIQEKGYEATRVEDICAAAGLARGSFFNFFKSKEDLALAATEHWNAVSGAVFASAAYRSLEDPLERVLAYLDFRKGLLRAELPVFTCLVLKMVQEVYETHPAIREACEKSISRHATTLEIDIELARKKYHVRGDWTPRSLALHTQAVIQGAYALTKAQGGGPETAATMMDHLRRYVEMLFGRNESREAGRRAERGAGSEFAGGAWRVRSGDGSQERGSSAVRN